MPNSFKVFNNIYNFACSILKQKRVFSNFFELEEVSLLLIKVICNNHFKCCLVLLLLPIARVKFAVSNITCQLVGIDPF